MMTQKQTSAKALGGAAGCTIGGSIAFLATTFWPEFAAVQAPLAELITAAFGVFGVWRAPANRPRA